MTENQKLLLPYLEARTNDVINDNTSSGIVPLRATAPEIIADIRGDVLECMRELHRQKVFTGTETINDAALKRFEK